MKNFAAYTAISDVEEKPAKGFAGSIQFGSV